MLEIAILNSRQHAQTPITGQSISIGSGESSHADQHLLVDDPLISPIQCLVEAIPDRPDRLRISNCGHSIVLNDGIRVHTDTTCELPLPLNLRVGDTQIQVNRLSPDSTLDSAIVEVPRYFLFETENLKSFSDFRSNKGVAHIIWSRKSEFSGIRAASA